MGAHIKHLAGITLDHTLFALAAHIKQARSGNDAPVRLEMLSSDIGDAGLIFQRREDDAGSRTGSLTDKDDARTSLAEQPNRRSHKSAVGR